MTLEPRSVRKTGGEGWHDDGPNGTLRTIEEVAEGVKGRELEDGAKEDLGLGLIRQVGMVLCSVEDPRVAEELFEKGFLDVLGCGAIGELPVGEDKERWLGES